MLNGGREFKIDFETYNICKSIIQGDLEKIQNISFKTEDEFIDFTCEITVNVKDIIAVQKHSPKIRIEVKIMDKLKFRAFL